MASSIERTQGQTGSSASTGAVDSRTSLTVDVARSRKKTAPANTSSPQQFRARNLGLTGEKPSDMNVVRGYYLDILV